MLSTTKIEIKYFYKSAGIKEDLEDMKLEAIQKKRKIMAKKRKLHDDDD